MVFSNPPPKHDRSLKRGRTKVNFPSLPPITSSKPDDYPRFLIVVSLAKENPVSSQSVSLLSKFLDGIIGKQYKAKKQRTGELLVEVTTEQQATKLLKENRMAGLDIKVTPHRSLNSSQGVISDPDLTNETETDLLEGLKDQGVTAVRRITIRRDNKEIPTKHLILTFNRFSLPEFIKAGFICCSVRPFIPNPRRFFKCRRFGTVLIPVVANYHALNAPSMITPVITVIHSTSFVSTARGHTRHTPAPAKNFKWERKSST